MSKQTRSAKRNCRRAAVQVTGPARTTRARARAAAQACDVETEDLNSDISSESPKKRTEEQAIDEKRRKRSKTCITKLVELSVKTGTPAIFAYLDPKTSQWDGRICMPDGQTVPENIGDELKELQKRGPRVRRRGRAKKNSTHHSITVTGGNDFQVPSSTQSHGKSHNEDTSRSNMQAPVPRESSDIQEDNTQALALPSLDLPNGSVHGQVAMEQVEETFFNPQAAPMPFSPVFAQNANMMSGESWMPMVEVDTEPWVIQDQVWNTNDLGSQALCFHSSGSGYQENVGQIPELLSSSIKALCHSPVPTEDCRSANARNLPASNKRVSSEKAEELKLIFATVKVKLEEDERAVKNLFMRWDSLIKAH